MSPDPSGATLRSNAGHGAHPATVAASRATAVLGSLPAVAGSILLVVVWALTGPVFGFSDTWQLIINTTTTIITFNMVFIIQNTQNRDGQAVQVKLDAILQALERGDEEYIGIEDLPERDIEQQRRRMQPGADT